LNVPFVKQRFLSLGECGLVAEYNTWLDQRYRTYCASLDLVLGAAPADGTAAVLIKNP